MLWYKYTLYHIAKILELRGPVIIRLTCEISSISSNCVWRANVREFKWRLQMKIKQQHYHLNQHYPPFEQLTPRFYLVFISWAAFMKLLHVSENVGNLSRTDSTCFSTDINYKKRTLLHLDFIWYALYLSSIRIPIHEATFFIHQFLKSQLLMCVFALLRVTSLGNLIPNTRSFKFFANDTQ